MMAFLDMREELADKKYNVFIHDNLPIPCNDVEIKNDWVYCKDSNQDTFLMIPVMQIKAIKVHEKRGGLR